ncbi:hypothetical protein BJV77DRAFT_1043705 [Russula vinacea]|nr:hypothetical protein BJV77DRAFT_1043705 [Russula vinacea]
MCAVVTPRLNICDAPGSQALEPGLAMSEFAWFERASFCLITLLIQCDTNTLTSIFSDGVVYTDSPSSTIGSFWATDRDYFIPADLEPYTLSITIAKVRQLRASERYFSTFLIQAMFSLNLRSLDISPPLPAGRHAPGRTLSSADGEGDASDGGGGRRQWAGYYTVGRQGTDLDPPMFLELTLYRLPLSSSFKRTFTLRGNCHMLTGTVVVTKAYATHLWIWRGMVTPFGMAGTWGPWGLGSANGWWWVWPREWSNDPATTGPD